MDDERICEHCQYFAPEQPATETRLSKDATCRYNPPGRGQCGWFPQVDPEDWCRLFERRQKQRDPHELQMHLPETQLPTRIGIRNAIRRGDPWPY